MGMYHEFDLDTIAHKSHRPYTLYFWITVANRKTVFHIRNSLKVVKTGIHL